jgi:hypothetical protein
LKKKIHITTKTKKDKNKSENFKLPSSETIPTLSVESYSLAAEY